jgi:hypothetical protein
MLRDYVTLDYNQANISFLRSVHSKARCLEFPLIPDDSFKYDFQYSAKDFDINFDVVFYGSSSIGNRLRKLQAIANTGLRVKCVGGVFGRNLSRHLVDAKAVLNLHGFESKIFEVIRCLRPAALGIPIISETSQHSRIANWEQSGVIFLDSDNLPLEISNIMNQHTMLLSAGRKLRSFVEDPKWPITAREVIKAAINYL